MNVLAIDTGGTHVKILATGEKTRREFSSGPTLTPRQMVSAVKKLAGDWKYDVVSIGYPGLVVHGRQRESIHRRVSAVGQCLWRATTLEEKRKLTPARSISEFANTSFAETETK